MPKANRKRSLAVLLSLLVIASLALAMVPAPVSAAVTVQAVPKMVSLWGLGLFPNPNFAPGPGSTTLIVNAPVTASVTFDLKAVFDAIFPTAASRVALFPQDMRDAWNTLMASFTSIPFTWDAGLGAWTHVLGTEMPITEPSAAVRAIAESVLFQDAVLGDVMVNVQVNTATVRGKVTVVDMQRPMLPGWNGVSTPAALAPNRFSQLTALGDGLRYDAAVRWDAGTQRWVTFISSRTLDPVDAVFVHATDFTTMGFIFNRGNTAPNDAALKQGWNAIGLAAFRGKDNLGVDSYFEMPADEALQSLGNNFSSLVSPGESWAYTQRFSYGDTEIGTYDWDFDQDAWVYAAGSAGTPQMTVGGVYWVYLTAADSLAGLSQTPVRLSSWNPF